MRIVSSFPLNLLMADLTIFGILIIMASSVNGLKKFQDLKRERGYNASEQARNSRFCECGIENDQSIDRIMGGREVYPPHRYPWMAIILKRRDYKYRVICGGSLINRQYVLTAAHCVEDLYSPQIYIVLGAHDSLDSFHGTSPLPVTDLIMHEDYDTKTNQNDIALVRLEEPVEYSRTIRPICLATYLSMSEGGNQVITAGWGSQKEGGRMNRYLHKIDMEIIDNAACRKIMKKEDVTDTIICAGADKGLDTCGGDSGGPLMYKFEDQLYLIGVISWGYGCGLDGKPGFYTRVTSYLDWIEYFVDDAPKC